VLVNIWASATMLATTRAPIATATTKPAAYHVLTRVPRSGDLPCDAHAGHTSSREDNRPRGKEID
jgi:hypothetical protein